MVTNADLVVLSFREEPTEPPFLDDIRKLAESRGATFIEARSMNSPRMRAFWEDQSVDLILAVSWRYMIPSDVYRKARLGAFVFHDSLLPGYRGFAPTVWAIVNGEDHTGVTLFAMVDEVDAGDIVDQERVTIGPSDTIADVLERGTQTYLVVLDRQLHALLDGRTSPRPQAHQHATYTCKRTRDDDEIDWRASTSSIYNLIRATTAPYPGAWTTLDDKTMLVWEARELVEPRRYIGRRPGRVLEVRPGEGTVVATGDGSILLTRVQFQDEATVCAAAILRNLSQTLGHRTQG